MKAQPQFSILDMVRAKLAGTWARIDSKEFRTVSDLHERYGLPDSGYDCIPADALSTRATPLTAAGSSNGGYLDTTALDGYLPAFQAQTNLLRLGATQVSLDTGTTVTPRGVTAITPTWLSDEVTPPTQSLPTFGQITFARKTLMVSVTMSRQLLLQSDAENVVRTELVRACAAEIDKQGIQGTNNAGLPLGLVNIPTIASASGATLAYPAIVTQMQTIAVSNAIVAPVALGFLTNPVIAGLLKQRYYSAANLKIWEGSVPAGTIDGLSALSSNNVPAGILIHADWSQLLVAQWADGLQIDVDPFTGFQSALVTVRLSVAVDFQISNASAFNILTSVT
jgi:HK97 family phage major capsid protein